MPARPDCGMLGDESSGAPRRIADEGGSSS